MPEEEIWKSIDGFENLYEVSNTGKIKSLERTVKTKNGTFQSYKERILKQHYNKRYFTVVLCKDGKIYPKLVHRIVAETFIQNPLNKPYVDHIDTCSKNNNVSNLRWVTQKENCLNPITRENNSKSKIGHKPYLLKHTEESKRKMSEIKRGKPLSEEHKKRISETHKHWKMEGGKRKWY